MNPLVPDHNGTLEGWYNAINSMFGDVVQANTGGVDADVGQTPPFVTHIPADALSDCFTFKEIKTKSCSSYDQAQIELMELIESKIDSQMTEPRDTSKATIVWRRKPEIENYHNQSWYGYARFRVLDKNSQLQNYFK